MEDTQAIYHGILWGLRRSIRYHARRRQFFERFNLTSNAVGVIFGSATILSLLNISMLSHGSQSILWTVLPAATVTLMSALNLVIGTVQMAQKHHDLVRKYTDLETELIIKSPSESLAREVSAKRLQIEADEPPIHRIVNILCHNELMKSEGYDPETYSDHYYKVSTWQRFFSPFFDLGADNIKPIHTPKSTPC